jgi:anti-anti-sigma factor
VSRGSAAPQYSIQAVARARRAPVPCLRPIRALDESGLIDPMCAEQFGGSVTAAGDVTTVALQGEADLAVRAEFQQLIEDALQAGTPSVVVDLERLRYLESACLRTLLHARSAAEEQGRTFVVRNASGIVMRVLDVAGVADILTGESNDEQDQGGTSRPDG